MLAHGGLWRNRARVADGAALLEAGDTLFIHQPPGGVYAEVALDAARILYEDAWLIAVNKPPGVYVEFTPWDAGGHLRGAVRSCSGADSPQSTQSAQRMGGVRGVTTTPSRVGRLSPLRPLRHLWRRSTWPTGWTATPAGCCC